MKKETSEVLDGISKLRPMIRTVLAFVAYLRFSIVVDDFKVSHGYVIADEFINQLEKDVEAQG